ncbi:Putative membrane-bound ClpP-class protease associated with aq_911 [Olavius sp. associated proteobacterium Delta 1]|nr:Putative membrane-bound ClpP-class protease associated with aq_911 [Olavius sp. associated proteobacterium Delta 1]
MKTKIFLIAILSVVLLGANVFAEEQSDIYIIRIADAISPGTAEFIKSGIKTAEENGAACIIIELDTPGGFAESMRLIVQNILASRVPVVVFVSPSGARAASAGVMITMAADVAAMAPGTNIGAAHPVGAGGKEIDGTMSEKIINDMVAQAKSVAEKRGRNANWVEDAIRESVSVTETEALKENIIDLIAKDTEDLIRQLNGREIKDRGKLELDEANTIVLQETLRTKILRTISNPNIAYILMMIGLAGLYFELSHPGAIFPGVIGGISLILAFFAMQTLPVNYAGILLIVLAIIFFIMEMKITSYGLLSVAGIVSLFLGSLMLFEGDTPDMKLSWQVLLPTIIVISGFFAAVASLVFRAQISKPTTGAGGLVGEIGLVKKALKPEGKVFVHGELWNARAKEPLDEDVKVRVVKVVNLILEVESVDESAV